MPIKKKCVKRTESITTGTRKSSRNTAETLTGEKKLKNAATGMAARTTARIRIAFASEVEMAKIVTSEFLVNMCNDLESLLTDPALDDKARIRAAMTRLKGIRSYALEHAVSQSALEGLTNRREL